MSIKSIISRNIALMLSASLIAVMCAVPSQAQAAEPTLTATETVANGAAGSANTQTNATTTATANVAEVKATRTVAVGAVPANAETITIGLCIVTFNTGATPDADCSNNNAAINTTTNSSTALVATALRALTGVTDTGHGALTLTGATTNVIITTTGTEASATAITYTDGTTGDITSSSSTSGTIPVAQVWRVTPANVEIGDVFTTIINGTTVSFTATAATVANVTAGLTTAINASAAASAVTASDQTTRVDVTSDTAGTAFTITSSATNLAAVAQTVTFTPADIINADYNIVIDGVTYTMGVGNNTTVQELVELLTPGVDASASVSCTEDNTMITCVAAVAGTAFSYSSDVTHYVVDSGSSRRSGGGTRKPTTSTPAPSANSNSDRATLEAKLAELKAKLAAMGVPAATVATAFNRDLEMGATGADVMALQKYLNTHGYAVTASGAGSAGMETEKFGALTKAALIKLQVAAGITPAAGYFGAKTRAYIAAHQ